MKLRTMMSAPLALIALTACDLPGDEPPETPEVPDEVEGVAQALEDALFDKLQCEDLLRPSTIERLRALIRDPTFQELEAVLTAPEDLATVVSFAGAEVEGGVVVARNIERLLATGALQDLVENGWDGVQCGEPVSVECTAGSGTSTVDCAADVPSAIALDLERCTLGGTVHEGHVTLERIPGDDTRAIAHFDGLAFNEVRTLDGAVAVRIGETAAATRASLDGGLAYIEHGGPDGGLSCGARMELDALEVSLDEGVGFVSFSARRDTVADSLALETFGEHLQIDTSECPCPLANSGLRVDVPRPLGRANETARAEVSWSSSTDTGLCAAATVALVGWPSDCTGLDASGDCAKGATERTLSGLLSALCAR